MPFIFSSPFQSLPPELEVMISLQKTNVLEGEFQERANFSFRHELRAAEGPHIKETFEDQITQCFLECRWAGTLTPEAVPLPQRAWLWVPTNCKIHLWGSAASPRWGVSSAPAAKPKGWAGGFLAGETRAPGRGQRCSFSHWLWVRPTNIQVGHLDLAHYLGPSLWNSKQEQWLFSLRFKRGHSLSHEMEAPLFAIANHITSLALPPCCCWYWPWIWSTSALEAWPWSHSPKWSLALLISGKLHVSVELSTYLHSFKPSADTSASLREFISAKDFWDWQFWHWKLLS